MIVLLGVSVSWSIAVDLTSKDNRPYMGSSQSNSALELAFGYNGLQRLTGQQSGGEAAQIRVRDSRLHSRVISKMTMIHPPCLSRHLMEIKTTQTIQTNHPVRNSLQRKDHQAMQTAQHHLICLQAVMVMDRQMAGAEKWEMAPACLVQEPRDRYVCSNLNCPIKSAGCFHLRSSVRLVSSSRLPLKEDVSIQNKRNTILVSLAYTCCCIFQCSRIFPSLLFDHAGTANCCISRSRMGFYDTIVPNRNWV